MQESKPSKKNANPVKKRRRPKDPDAPKRPLGPYFFYFRENNTKIKSENPAFNQKQVVAKIAADWKTLNEEQKEPYNAQSKADKLRYVQEKQVYEEKRAKKEEEEEKYNEQQNKRAKKASNKAMYDHNGNIRSSSTIDMSYINETQVRLKDVLGDDAVSFPSDDEYFAPYSPPDSDVEVKPQPVVETAPQAFQSHPPIQPINMRPLNEADFKQEVGGPPY